MKILKAQATAGALLLATISLTGCATTVTLDPAPLANDPNCAEVIVRLPELVGDQSERPTNAQATAAWGDPASVLLRCGLEPVLVSDLPCVTAGGVDWLVDESEKPSYRFISFARTPGTEIIVDSNTISGITALEALGPAVQNIEASKTCTAAE
ncbi:DUF3515 family protein [Rhodoluna limnophila]|uniref:DUF3515 family protein n=1 Tax=Rhodoluna limnophila TaxID=232537 RepID=UPI001FE7D2C3|nr:DUF3515 family protein [Rhodoluna limnophila]